MSYEPINLQGGVLQTTVETVGDTLNNNTGSTLLKTTVVKADSDNNMSAIDVTSRDEVYAIQGVLPEDVSDGTSGRVISKGRVEDITSTAAIGSVVYLSKTSDLTTDVPEIGVGSFLEGDFIVRIGFISRNKNNVTLKDLVINMEVIGEL